MEKHFVTFYSPGTFFVEQTSKEIDSWNVDKAIEMSKDITEQYGARPFGFQFSTRARNENDLDSKEINRSNMYYLGGTLYSYEDVVARNDPDEEILRSNMKYNNIKTIIENNNSWKYTGEFKDGDVLLQV